MSHKAADGSRPSSERRTKSYSPKSQPNNDDVAHPPSIQQDTSKSPIDGISTLKACLVAPTRKPTASTSKSQSTADQNNAKTTDISAAFSGRIEIVVKDAYKDVKSRRSAEREKLVRSVINESLGDVVNSSLVEKRRHKERGERDSKQKGHQKSNGETASPKKRKHKRSKDDKSSSKYAKTQTNGALVNGHQLNSNQAAVSTAQQVARSSFKRMVFPRLPSSNCSSHTFCAKIATDDQFTKPHNLVSDNKYGITIKAHNPSTRSDTTTKHQPLLLEGTHPPRPTQSSVIFLKSFFSAEDERNLAHIPYFGEDTHGDFDFDLFDIEERIKRFEYGPPYCEKETVESIDEVLKLLMEREPKWFESNTVYDLTSSDGEDSDDTVSSSTQTIKQVHSILAQLSNVKVERVQERHEVVFANEAHESKSKAKKKSSKSPGSPSRTQKKHIKEDSSCYHEAIDSHLDLFCRICFTYDCQVHGNIPKADIQLLSELAVSKDQEGHWKELDKDINIDELKPNNDSEKEEVDLDKNISSGNGQFPIKHLSTEKEVMCERLFVIFNGDIKKIAQVIDATTESVDDVISEKKLKLQPPTYVTSRKKKGKEHSQSMKNYNPKWLANIQGCEIHPAFIPCDHIEPCSEKTCSCVKNKFFCNKACAWGAKSKNFFRGCACKAGQCRSSSCACWAANRECDPDLCKACGACTDPPQQLADKQRCRNDNISMRRHARLLLAESSINAAGWGLYTKHALQKGSYVHEYAGEVISQEEAERRGIIYDKLNMSYLFNLSSDYTVDATRKGNKLRYANHSSNAANCEARMIRVNGDMRIGLFAKVDIDAQSELFFDYRYDETIDNDLIIKPAHKFHWMKSPTRKDDKTAPANNIISTKAAKKNAY